MAERAPVSPAVAVPVRARAARPDEIAHAEALAAAVFADHDRTPRPEPATRGGADHPPISPSALHRVALDADDQVVGTATARLSGQWYGGRRLITAALSGLAVDVTQRGRGVGRILLADLLGAATAAGAQTCVLIPSTHTFYARSGCGIGGRRPVFALSTVELRSALPRPRGAYGFRPARSGDAPAVAALVGGRARRGTALLDHDRPGAGPLDPSGPGRFVAELDDQVVGWCELRRQPATRPGATYDLIVADLLGRDPDAELALWRGLVADPPTVARVAALVPPGSVVERYAERLVDPVGNETWMLRLLDVDAALQDRGYPAGLCAELGLDVTDATLPANAGARTLQVRDGRARVIRRPPCADDVTLDVAALASVFTGYLDPVLARHEGTVEATPAAAELMRTLFAGPAAQLARTF